MEIKKGPKKQFMEVLFLLPFPLITDISRLFFLQLHVQNIF